MNFPAGFIGINGPRMRFELYAADCLRMLLLLFCKTESFDVKFVKTCSDDNKFTLKWKFKGLCL